MTHRQIKSKTEINQHGKFGGNMLDTTRMSSRGQIVIPFRIRKKLNIKYGQSFTVVVRGTQLFLKPTRTRKS